MQKEPLSLFMTKNVMKSSLLIGLVLLLGIISYLHYHKDDFQNVVDDGISFEDANDDHDSWQSYQNTDFGFELEYPEGWFLYEEGDGIYIQPDEEEAGTIPGPHADALSIKIEKLSEDTSLEDIIRNKREKAGVEFEQSEIEIGGEDGLMVKTICEGVGCGSPEWYFAKDGYLYSLDSNLGYSAVFDEIIETFRFIEERTCSREGDLSLLENSAYPSSKARITSEEGNSGGRSDFPNRTFAINDPDFILEGVNVPEVNQIDVEWDWDGRVEKVENFMRGDTHWCFEISEEKGNLNKGVNIYFVRLYLDNEETIEYSVQLIWSAFEGEIEDEEVLHINWFDDIQEESVTNFFSQEQLDNFYTDCNYYDYALSKQKPCYDLFSFYRAGVVNGGKYDGYDYYLVSRTFIGHGESDDYYRMLFTSEDGRFILLSEYSNEPDSKDKVFFTRAGNITIENLLPKENILIPDTEYYLEPHSDSPNSLFSDMVETGFYTTGSEKLFTDPDAGDVYLEKRTGAFIVRVNDGSVMVYRIKLPFVETREESNDWNTDDLLLDITFEDGKQNAEYYLHGSRYQFVCAGGQLYDIVSDDFLDVDTQLKLAGTSSSGDNFYEISDEEKLRDIYNNKRTIPYEGISGKASYIFYQDMTFEEFSALHPLLFWEDPFGRWIQFTDNIFSSAAECGGGFGKSAL